MEELLTSNLFVQQVKKLYKVGELLGLDIDTLEALSQPGRPKIVL